MILIDSLLSLFIGTKPERGAGRGCGGPLEPPPPYPTTDTHQVLLLIGLPPGRHLAVRSP